MSNSLSVYAPSLRPNDLTIEYGRVIAIRRPAYRGYEVTFSCGYVHLFGASDKVAIRPVAAE